MQLHSDSSISKSVNRDRQWLMEGIVESADDAIISHTLDGIVTSWNKGAEHIFGYRSEEALGQPVSLIYFPDHENDLASILECIRSGQRTSHYDAILRRNDGQEIAASVSDSPILNPVGQIVGVSRIIRDVTDQKRAEAILQNAEKLSVMGRLAASMAHDVNNPLAALTNLLYLLQGEEMAPEAKEYLRSAEHELARVNHIASQVFGFYREASPRRCSSLTKIVDEALSFHEGRIGSIGIVVQKRYRTVPPVFCWEGKLKQLFVNLIGNAVDAMPKGGTLKVAIGYRRDWKTSQCGVCVSVADTGSGMTEEVSRNIFEPFYTTKEPTRTGLGLWMSEQIVHRHQGRILFRTISSKEIHGSIFSCLLPIHGGPPTAEPDKLLKHF